MDLRSASPLSWARYASGGSFKSPAHILLLNRILMAAAAGESWARRVIIQMPPRHGKSEFCSAYFPAWYLGMFPDKKIILASATAALAQGFGRRNRDLLEAYGPDLFDVRVRQDVRARDHWEFVKRRGAMYAMGESGTITGRGFHLAIVDDPIKNSADALSETVRDRWKEWFRSTLLTRQESSEAPIIIIQTRWHEEDLAGWLQSAAGPEDWLVISLPAIAEEDEEIWLPDDDEKPAWTRRKGEPLWPQKFDLNALHKLMAGQGGADSYWWTALYQQRPVPLGGGILKPDQFRTYELVPDGYLLDTPAGPLLIPTSKVGRFGTMDLAVSEKKQADWSVISALGLATPNLLVLDVLRGHWAGPDLPRVAERVMKAYRLAYLGVESVGLGLSVVQDMQRGNALETPPRLPLAVKGIPPLGDKVTRALTLAARMGSGHVYVLKDAPWLPMVVAEMALFPKGAHDDIVDTLSYGALEQVGFGDNELHAE